MVNLMETKLLKLPVQHVEWVLRDVPKALEVVNLSAKPRDSRKVWGDGYPVVVVWGWWEVLEKWKVWCVFLCFFFEHFDSAMFFFQNDNDKQIWSNLQPFERWVFLQNHGAKQPTVWPNLQLNWNSKKNILTYRLNGKKGQRISPSNYPDNLDPWFPPSSEG